VEVGTAMVKQLELGPEEARSEMVQLLEWSLDLLLRKVVVLGKRTEVVQTSGVPEVALPWSSRLRQWKQALRASRAWEVVPMAPDLLPHLATHRAHSLAQWWHVARRVAVELLKLEAWPEQH